MAKVAVPPLTLRPPGAEETRGHSNAGSCNKVRRCGRKSCSAAGGEEPGVSFWFFSWTIKQTEEQLKDLRHNRLWDRCFFHGFVKVRNANVFV